MTLTNTETSLTPLLHNELIYKIHLFSQGVEFHKATVVTTVDTTTAPLSDVYFPSVTICNINQVRPFSQANALHTMFLNKKDKFYQNFLG